MADNPAEAPSDPAGWEAYWRLTPEGAAHRAGGPQDEVLAGVWGEIFARALGVGTAARVLDYACGNGAVTRFAVERGEASGGSAPVLFGFDSALAAMRAYRERYPDAHATVADGLRTPYADGAFDLVASQFGIEYAGLEAFGEAARLVAPGGTMAAIVHMRGSAIHRECEVNRLAMETMRHAQLLPTAKEVFLRGTAVLRGQGSRAAYQRADARLAIAVKEVEAIFAQSGDLVAGGTLRRLYDDLAHMYPRIGAYDPREVADWADRMARECGDYASRMAAMLGAAVDEAGLETAASLVAGRGLAIRVREALRMGPDGGEPAAWILIADRP